MNEEYFNAYEFMNEECKAAFKEVFKRDISYLSEGKFDYSDIDRIVDRNNVESSAYGFWKAWDYKEKYEGEGN